MTAVKDSWIWSLLSRLGAFFAALYGESGFRGFWDRFALGWTRLWRESLIGSLFTRSRRSDDWWGDSLTCRVLTWLINLPGLLLGKLFSLSPGLWEGSAITRGVSWLGKNSAALFGWLLLGVLCVPQEYWNNAYSAAGAALLVLLTVAAALSAHRPRFDVKAVGFWGVLFALFVFIACAKSVSGRESFRFLIFHMTCMASVLILASTCKDESCLVRICTFASLGVLVASLYGFVQKLRGIAIDYTWVDVTVSGDTPGRVTSFFENPNIFGVLLVMLLPLCLVLIFTAKGLRPLIGAAAFVVGTGALLLTYSRGAWAAYVLSVGVTVMLLRPKLFPVFFVAGCAALAAMPASIINRILSSFTGDSSMSYRGTIYSAAKALIAQEPFGVGLGSDVVAETIDSRRLFKTTAGFIHSHNIYLQISAEMGVFAAGSFVLCMLSKLRQGVLSVWRAPENGALKAIAAASTGGLLGAMLFAMADYPWSYPRIMLVFWAVFGILAAAVKLLSQRGKADVQDIHC